MKLFISFLLLTLPFLLWSQPKEFTHPKRGFVSWKPAPVWEDALLSGNGTIGAMVFGKPHDETIILNHALCYLPLSQPVKPINQASRLAEIRDLLAQGKFVEASRIPVEQARQEGINDLLWIDPFVPFANIRLSMPAGNVSNYIRMVDFETGEGKVQWEQDGNLFQRSLFVSRADNIVVMKIASTGTINCELSFARHPVAWDQWGYINSTVKSAESFSERQFITYRTEFVHQWEGNVHGFEGVGYIMAPGGTVTSKGSQLVIENAGEVLLIIGIEPNYDFKKSLIPSLKANIQRKISDYDQLLLAHKKIHGGLFSKVRLDLGGGADSQLQSEALVLKARNNVTPAIIEKQFDAARYNIISSVGTNPPNLQGIWSGTWSPPWSSGFTHDGNVEVAVSALLSGSTPELMQAYINYHHRMLPYYRDNARNLFGTKGIVLPAHSSSHGWTIHFSETWCLSFWTGGAGWTAGILYDYYLYTGDKTLLKSHIYPFMREAVKFYEDFLFTGPNGKYVFSPSYSPENNPANGASQACINATMDVMIAKELLRNCIEAGKVLKESKAQIKVWNDMLSRMPDYRVNDEGALAEWIPNTMDDNYSHRHVSHLYSLYERIDPDFKKNEVLMKAAKQAVEKRMYHRRRENGGEMVFGLAQMGMVTANLHDRHKTGEIIDWISRYYWAPSMATYHNSGNLFNMDVSGGFPALIMRSLAYSEPGLIRLLPALPVSWPTGSIDGMSLRGQIIMDKLKWNNNNVSVTLTSAVDQKVEVLLPSEIQKVEASLPERFIRSKTNQSLLVVSLKANQTLTLEMEVKSFY